MDNREFRGQRLSHTCFAVSGLKDSSPWGRSFAAVLWLPQKEAQLALPCCSEGQSQLCTACSRVISFFWRSNVTIIALKRLINNQS